MDTFIRDTEVYAGRVRAGETLGREGFFRPRFLFTSDQGLSGCLGCGSIVFAGSTRQKGQSSAVLGLSGRGVFGLSAVLE